MNAKDVVETFIKRNYLVSPDLIDSVVDDGFVDKLSGANSPVVLSKDLFVLLKENGSPTEINWSEFEKSRMLLEKGKDSKIYKTFIDLLSYHVVPEKKQVLDTISREIKKPEKSISLEKEKRSTSVVITKGYVDNFDKKRDVEDFVRYFGLRYNFLRDVLVNRPELHDAVSINRIVGKREREEVTIIGLVQDKKITKNGHVLLTLEDNTGMIDVIITKGKGVFSIGKDLVLDEIIGVVGVNASGAIFAETICFPDIPINKKLKKSEDDVWVGFISDIHLGSKNFLEKEFLSFISWVNGGGGRKHKEIIKNLKYIFVVGDLVDGVGIYPGQEDDLDIKDVKLQYDKLALLLSKFRDDIHLIISPGNHDAMRLAHPQPILDKKYAAAIHELENVTLVTNPSYVNIHSSKDFPGFDVLVYHGYGFHYYVDNVDSLRLLKARKDPKHIMKFLLQRRHLSPSHGATLYIPDNRGDSLVIDKVPDIMVSGELHYPNVDSYNGVVTVNCSCWQSATEYELKMGNEPDPCKVPLMNLKTGEVKILDFSNEG